MCQHLSEAALLAGLEAITASPKDQGTLELIVIRPRDRERTVLTDCAVSSRLGAHGDMWSRTCWWKLPDGSPHPDAQLAIMNSRCIALLAQDRARWALAGDQLYLDMDLSTDNLPVGQRLALGTAVLQITDTPHTACRLFEERFGKDAVRFVNSARGKQLRLRGVYARVVLDGHLRTGDVATKVAPGT